MNLPLLTFYSAMKLVGFTDVPVLDSADRKSVRSVSKRMKRSPLEVRRWNIFQATGSPSCDLLLIESSSKSKDKFRKDGIQDHVPFPRGGFRDGICENQPLWDMWYVLQGVDRH